MIITDLSILRKKNEPVMLDEANDIIDLLERELKNSADPGVGLAAPQIGINKKVAIIRVKEEKYINLVNPKITEKNNPYINLEEGCLSLPGQVFNTQRYKEIVVVDDLHPNGFVAVGFIATVIQHELDHLDSILISDRSVGKNKIGRNDPCPCGKFDENGKPVKYKKCHGK